jgi:hypothetical protein
LVDDGGRRVDLHPVVFDRQGNGWQELGGGAWGAYPVEGLSGVGMVSGRYVRCLTPQLQVRDHLGYPLGSQTNTTWGCWPTGSACWCHPAWLRVSNAGCPACG